MERSVMKHLQVHRNDSDFEPIGLPDRTSAEPGTREKIDVLRKRVEAGEQLHHPRDAWANSPPHSFVDTGRNSAFLVNSLERTSLGTAALEASVNCFQEPFHE
jgi:hypothetical protein